MTTQDEIRLLQRIAVAIEQLNPPPEPLVNIKDDEAYLWDAAAKNLLPVAETAHVPLDSLHGIDSQRDTLLANSLQHARGFSANNALLWGARGTGKSALIKAIHAEVNRQIPKSVVLVEIHREDIKTLPDLIHALRGWVIRRFIILCDDVSLAGDAAGYSCFETALEGGIQGKPEHIIFYATAAKSSDSGDATPKNRPIAEHFGLWIDFQPLHQDTYLQAVSHYTALYRLKIDAEQLRADAIAWQAARGECSGRVAWQFIVDLAGKIGRRII